MARFDSAFSARSTHVQPVASPGMLDLLEDLGTGGKVLGVAAMVAGAAMIIGGDPLGGQVCIKGVSLFLAGNFTKSATQTYAQASERSATGVRDSAKQVAERLGNNFMTGLSRRW